MSRSCTRRRGTVLVLSAVLIAILVAFVALAVDVGYIMYVRNQLQNAADAGALAGAGVLRDDASVVASTAESFAELNAVAASNADVRPSDIQVGHWDNLSRVFSTAGEPNAVRVTCRLDEARGNSPALFFARVFGNSTINLNATAVALAKPSRCTMILGLNRVSMSGSSYTDSYKSEAGPYGVGNIYQRGHVCSNGHILMSGYSAIHGDAHPGPGKVAYGGTITGETTNLDEALHLPPVDLGDSATNNNNDQIGTSNNGLVVVNPSTKSFVLQSGDSITLPPGTHYFSSMVLYGGSTVHITGPTTIFVNGACSLSGGSVLNQHHRPGDLQLYCTGTTCSISGIAEFHGVVYAPNAVVSRSGNTDFYGMIAGKELTLSGTGGIHVDESLGVLWGTAIRPLLVE